MSSQPSRLPTFCAAEPTANPRTEDTGQATSGYAFGAIPTAEEWNWQEWTIGEWVEHLHERVARCEDTLDTSAVVWRLSRTFVDFTIGGPLSQTPALGGTYAWQGLRLKVTAGLTPVTFAAASTNYVHIRPQTSTTSRDPEPEILVSLNPSESGYATILEVTTGGATVTATAEPSGVGDGPGVAAPFNFLERVDITQATGGVAALRVEYANSGLSSGVEIEAQGGATQPALGITSLGIGANITAVNECINAVTSSSSATVAAENTGGGIALGATVDTSGVGLSVSATSGADGVYVAASGGGSPLILVPVALGPSVPTNGDIYPLLGGASSALRYREGGVTYFVHASQDGISPGYQLTTATTTLAPATGPTTLQTLNYYLRQGGRYLITWSCLHGGDYTASTTVSYDCRVNAVAQLGASTRLVDPPLGVAQFNTGGGPYFTGVWWYQTVYTSALADGTYAIDLRATTSAGVNNRTFANRMISVFCLDS